MPLNRCLRLPDSPSDMPDPPKLPIFVSSRTPSCYLIVMTDIASDLAARCMRIADETGAGPRPTPSGVDGLTVVRNRAISLIAPEIYQPMICLVLQGAKEILHGERAVRFDAGMTAIVSHELVTGARIVKASDAEPYVALACRIDIDILRTLQGEIEPDLIDEARSEAVATGTAEAGVIDTMARLLDLRDKPIERRVLDPMIRKELHFRVLLTRNGAMLRQLAQPGSPASRIARTVAHIKQHWNDAIRTEELATIAGMSTSSFHEHFRTVMATTPLQYQKTLRLLEARRQLSETDEPVSSVAFAVGYESPTQFSRDYRRAYGAAPSETRVR
ncbi:AraC family transcriptional regulator N-terminal domain-containing protein [Brucellaceae bacterium D45D]